MVYVIIASFLFPAALNVL
uniref:Uncharacterized protein n=1 Tax=Rhizophora mucronata TaxID=61149 RepID=A0A2P2NZ10_RHIMU